VVPQHLPARDPGRGEGREVAPAAKKKRRKRRGLPQRRRGTEVEKKKRKAEDEDDSCRHDHAPGTKLPAAADAQKKSFRKAGKDERR
jgi:hypothetical protein